MNKALKLVVGLGTAGGFMLASGLALAQAEGPGPGGMGCPGAGYAPKGRMMSPEKMAAHFDEHLARVKKDLKITEQQEPLWQAFVEQKKKGFADMGRAMQERRDDMGKLSAPERMEKMTAMMKAHLDQQQATVESFKRLYDGLSPEQKATADKLFDRPMGLRSAKGPRKARGNRAHQRPPVEADSSQSK